MELWRNNVKIKSTTTKTTSVPLPPIGAYLFKDTISGEGSYDYHVYFSGDSKFEGCDIGDGSTVLRDEAPPNGEAPPVADAAAGLGIALLALLLVSDQ